MQKEERRTLIEAIQQVSAEDFESVALRLFQYQAANNPLYNEFLRLLNIRISEVKQLNEVPCLPISFFKSHILKTGDWKAEQIFESSGTTGQLSSKHYMRDTGFYLKNARRGFEQFFGSVEDWVFLALLPNYLERGSSSLVAMVADFIQLSRHEESSFYLYEHDDLAKKLRICIEKGKKTMLIGVSYALLDFAENHSMDLSKAVIVETGGMKGKRAERTKSDLHKSLCASFSAAEIHSEYGMTELLSQGWSKGAGIFYPSNTMQVRVMEVNDPFAEVPIRKSGMLNVIDLANVDTCAFIATEDIGRKHPDEAFEVLGRLDSSEWRGCNLLVGEE